MTDLEKKIGYCFSDYSLLETALTHTSYANEKPRASSSYERLEFLGDSILGFVTAEFLYKASVKLPEGIMTGYRAELVCEGSLFKIACALELGKYVRLGKGETLSGGKERPSILADIVESIIAALYLDGGFEQAKEFIYRFLLSDVNPGEYHGYKDRKTELQELVQKSGEADIEYVQTGESGPDHNKTFSFSVFVNGVMLGQGTGKSKKQAEQAAAGSALESLRNEF